MQQRSILSRSELVSEMPPNDVINGHVTMATKGYLSTRSLIARTPGYQCCICTERGASPHFSSKRTSPTVLLKSTRKTSYSGQIIMSIKAVLVQTHTDLSNVL